MTYPALLSSLSLALTTAVLAACGSAAPPAQGPRAATGARIEQKAAIEGGITSEGANHEGEGATVTPPTAAGGAEAAGQGALDGEVGIGTGAGAGTPRAANAPSLQLDEPRVIGHLEASAAGQTIRRDVGQLQACYEQGLRARGDLAGKLVVDFSVGATGKTSDVKVTGPLTSMPALRDCVQHVFEGMAFPKPRTGTATITQVMRFSTGA
ncbi:MAG TPA: AgmX/PglI C-terminal domain-containing protein [Kofleriaceae bacterium]|nr:AgmX/PglI C-terminal domain-containing protein [Kofleriaceae bacterium]